MTARNFSSVAARATLTSSVSSGAATFQVSSTTGWPSAPFTLIVDRNASTEEVVTVTAIAGLTVTVTRGEDGTSAISHTSGASLEHGVSARDFSEANAHINATSGIHGVSGTLVGSSDVAALITADRPVNKTLAADASITATSYADLTGMTVTLTPGNYDISVRVLGTAPGADTLSVALAYSGTTTTVGYNGFMVSGTSTFSRLTSTSTTLATALGAGSGATASLNVTQNIVVSTSGTLSLQAKVGSGTGTVSAKATSLTVTQTA